MKIRILAFALVCAIASAQQVGNNGGGGVAVVSALTTGKCTVGSVVSLKVSPYGIYQAQAAGPPCVWGAAVAGTFTARGTYAGGTTYAALDLVGYNGVSYVSLQNSNTGHTPSSSPTFWATPGPIGATGAAGNTVLNGSGAPSSGTGADGDFYIDTNITCLYGPKASGAWPGSCQSLVGAEGPSGTSVLNSCTVTLSATPVFNAAACNLFKLSLGSTAVVSSTLINAVAGQQIEIWITQDGTGGRAMNWPGNILNPCTVTPTHDITTILQGTFDGTNVASVTCSDTDTPTHWNGVERAEITSTIAGYCDLTFSSSAHTLAIFCNNSASRHIAPLTAGSTDQLASTDLSDTSIVMRLNATNAVTGYLNLVGGSARLPESTVGGLPTASSNTGKIYVVTNASSAGDCTVGSGTAISLCRSNGTAWVGLGDGTTAGAVTSVSGDGALINNSGSTGAVTVTLANAGAHKYWGNNSGSTGAPGYQSIGVSDLPAAVRYGVCDLGVGDTSGSAITDAQLGPQSRVCFIPATATIIELAVNADAGTPNVIVGKNHAGTISNIVSAALATAASGGIACSNTGGTTGLNGATTCSATLQNTSLAAGDYLELVSGTAGGTAKFFVAHVVYEY